MGLGQGAAAGRRRGGLRGRSRVGGEPRVRPTMDLALSYDPRGVDGRESVTFLVHVKDTTGDPRRLPIDR